MNANFSRNLRRAAAFALTAACVFACHVSLADDQGNLKSVAKQLAGDISNYLTKDVNEARVAIGAFTAPASLQATSGRAITDALTTELTALKIEVDRTARLECRGEYFFDEDEKALQVRCEVIDSRDRKILKNFEDFVRDIENVATLLGVTGELSTAAVTDRANDLQAAVEKPQVVLKTSATGGSPLTSLISASPDSQFAIEIGILDANGGFQPVAATNDNGQARVDLPKNAVYGIRVFNKSDQLCAVGVTIDGLNMFHFSEIPAYRALGKLIVPKLVNGGVIRGWHKTNATAFQFVVGETAESAAALAGKGPELQPSPEALGTITVSFAFAVAGDKPIPDEGIKSKGFGTGRGQEVPITFGEQEVRIGSVREVISVRYSR